MLFDNVNYYLNDYYYIVGDNTSESLSQTATTSKNVSGTLIIRERIDNKPVLEIVQYAFSSCNLITDVIIYAKLRSINKCAFILCGHLKYINIPSTCTFVGTGALLLMGADLVKRNITTTVEFNEGRRERIYIDKYAICSRYIFYIIYPNNIIPLFNSESAFNDVEAAYICAPVEFDFSSMSTSTNFSICNNSIFLGNSKVCITIKKQRTHDEMLKANLLIMILTYSFNEVMSIK